MNQDSLDKWIPFPISSHLAIDRNINIQGGYLAPEYALLGQLTKKADIYSFGVLILEIISGRSSSKSGWGHDMKDLLEWAWKVRAEDRLLDIVDPELEGYPEEEVLRFIKVALFCTQAVPHQRPSMKQVEEMLLSNGLTLDVKSLTQPGAIKKPIEPSSSSGSYIPYKDNLPSDTYGFITSAKGVCSSPVSMTVMQPR